MLPRACSVAALTILLRVLMPSAELVELFRGNDMGSLRCPHARLQEYSTSSSIMQGHRGAASASPLAIGHRHVGRSSACRVEPDPVDLDPVVLGPVALACRADAEISLTRVRDPPVEMTRRSCCGHTADGQTGGQGRPTLALHVRLRLQCNCAIHGFRGQSSAGNGKRRVERRIQ